MGIRDDVVIRLKDLVPQVSRRKVYLKNERINNNIIYNDIYLFDDKTKINIINKY